MSDIPIGSIVMYSGTLIPDGWLLCDGNNGTPNLIDRFVLGGEISNASGKNNLTLTGDINNKSIKKDTSSENINITVEVKGHVLSIDEIPAHTHTYHGFGNTSANIGSGSSYGENGSQKTGSVGGSKSHSHGASTGNTPHKHNVDTIPPYYILAFIMFAG